MTKEMWQLARMHNSKTLGKDFRIMKMMKCSLMRWMRDSVI